MSQPLPQQPGERSSRPIHLRLVDAVDGVARSPKALVEEAQAAERQGHREEARALYERALRALGQRNPGRDTPSASALLRWIARTHQVDGHFDAALDCLEAAHAAATASGSEADIGHAVNLQANVCVELGRLDEAEGLYREARERALRAGERKLAAMTAQNLGVIFSIRGDLLEALRHCELCLADYRALGVVGDVLGALNNLGMLQLEMHRWEAAGASFEEALQICDILGDVSVRVRLQINVARLALAQSDYTRAREACDRALELAQQTGDVSSQALTSKLYGMIARETGEFARAEAQFRAAEAIAEDRGDLLLLAETARERAELHRRQGRNRDTLQCLNRAHRLFTQLNARRDLAAVGRQMGSLEGEFLDVVRKWSTSIESKDHYTQGHCERVADFACALASRAGIDERTLFWFRIGALLHDVGKLIIPSEVLNKPGKLTPEEWQLMQSHPAAGAQMLADIEFPWDILPMVKSHHERWDGHGYPDGLAGERIPFTARILCIADVYDALTSERSYKPALAHEDAMAIMRREVGAAFDPALFPMFEAVVQDMAVKNPALLAGRRASGTPVAGASVVDAIVNAFGQAVPVAPAAPAATATEAEVAQAAAKKTPPPGRVSRGDVDDLTGIPLRRAFLERTTQALEERGTTHLSLLVIDVDHFKLVNDTYGHLQGDAVLRLVADTLRSHVRDTDLVARYAGDEFVALLPGSSEKEALEIGERLRVAVRSTPCPIKEGGEISITLSIGAATAPDHGDTVETLFAAADRALYESKRKGRDAVSGAGQPAEPVPAQLSLERFVGRAEEVRRLVKLLESAVKGEPQLVSITGEAGVGKSTLVRQLAADVRLRGGAMLLGRNLEADVRPPYGPWAEILDQVQRLNIVPARSWRELPRIVPALGEAASAAEPAASKYALLDEIAEYLRLAAATRPLVLILDDMQWADSSSWDALEHLQALLEKDRILICLTMRAEDTVGDPKSRRRRLSRDERFHELVLPRLSAPEMEHWLESVFRQQELGKEFPAFLYERTEGNPLFVIQVLRTLLDEGAVWHNGQRWTWRPVEELRIPVAIEDLLARRIERLSPEARTVLTTCAVIGRTFEFDLAATADAGGEDDLLDAVDEGVAASVLEPAHGGAGERYSFAHALLAEAMRRQANPRRLRRIHERVAQAICSRNPDAVAEIAGHYDRAGVADKAFHFAMLGGQRATAVYAHDEAAALFTTALRHAATPEEEVESRRLLAAATEAAGRYAEAEAIAEQLIASLAGRGDAKALLAARRQRERLRTLQGQALAHTLAACHSLLSEAEAAGAEEERVALLNMISQTHHRLGDWSAAVALARQCVQLAESAGGGRLLADAILRLGTAVLDQNAGEALEQYTGALKLFTELNDRFGQSRCHTNLGIVHSNTGNAPAAERAYHTAIDLAREVRALDVAAVAALNLGVLYMKGGRYDEAAERFQEGVRLFSVVKNESHRLAALYNLANLARERGQFEKARDLYQQTIELSAAIGQVDVEIGSRAGSGLSALALGDAASAEACAREVEVLIGERSDWWFQRREMGEALRVRLALAAGDVAGGLQRFHAALALAEHHDAYSAAWLVAECAGPLADAGYGEVWATVDRFRPQVATLGFAPLSARYEALMAR